MKTVHLHCPQNFTFAFESSHKGPKPSRSQKCGLKFSNLKWAYWFHYTFCVVISLVYKSVDYEKMWFIYCFPTPQKVADQSGKSQCKIVYVRNES